jgi:hypothetical protein
LNVLDEKTTPPAPQGELNAENLRRLDALNERKDREKADRPEVVKERGDFKKKGEKPAWALTKEQVE